MTARDLDDLLLDSLPHRIEGARAYCERRMSELAEGCGPGELPRAWFAYNSIERRLRPLVYEAERLERIDLGATCGRVL